MSFVSNNFHEKKLNKYGINIKTKYIVGNTILERNFDNSLNDDIVSGIRCEKDYYIKNNLVHKETNFDSRIEYTFISKEMEQKDYKCPNCGMNGKIKDFISGCPYCRTTYNIDYTNKDLGSKYHYDLVLKSNLYRVITGIIDLIISIILSFIFIKTTSRTFNQIDIIKVFIYGFILSLVLYYLFYIVDAYIILKPIKIYKNKENQKQIDFWNRTKIDKKTFFNNLNYELEKYYYSKENIIDFDILDYLKFNDFTIKNTKYVKVLVLIRIVTYDNKIKSKIIKQEFIFRKNQNDKLVLNEGVNLIKCHNCGASIDATKTECSYCHSKINYLQEWILDRRVNL
mgnify:FL=1